MQDLEDDLTPAQQRKKAKVLASSQDNEFPAVVDYFKPPKYEPGDVRISS